MTNGLKRSAMFIMPYKTGKKRKAQVRKEGLGQEKIFDTKKKAIEWETEMRKKPAEEWVEKKEAVCLAEWTENAVFQKHILKEYIQLLSWIIFPPQSTSAR